MSAKEELNKALQENTVDGTKYEGAIFAIQQLLHNNTKAIDELGKHIKSLEQAIKNIDSTVSRVPQNIDTSYSKALDSICTTMEVNVRGLDDNVKDVSEKLKKSCLDVDKCHDRIKNLQDDMEKISSSLSNITDKTDLDRAVNLFFVLVFLFCITLNFYTQWGNVCAMVLGCIYAIVLLYLFYKN